MKTWGILTVLLFLLSGCAAQPGGGDIYETLSESDVYFMEGSANFRIILTDLTLDEIEQMYETRYKQRFILDERTDNALFFTIRADKYYKVAVTPNDLDTDKAYAILITVGEDRP